MSGDELRDNLHEYQRLSQEGSALLADLTQRVQQLGGPVDSHEFRAEMARRMDVEKGILERLRRTLLVLEPSMLGSDGQAEIAQCVGTLQTQMSEFQRIQTRCKERLQDFIAKAQEMNKQPDNDQERAPLVPSPQRRIQDQVIKEEISHNEAWLREREQGIRDIERAMEDVQELFLDLGILVGGQQLAIDHIEANVEAVHSTTRGAAEQLERTNEYRKSRSWSLYSFIVAFIVALVVLLLLLLSM